MIYYYKGKSKEDWMNAIAFNNYTLNILDSNFNSYAISNNYIHINHAHILSYLHHLIFQNS